MSSLLLEETDSSAEYEERILDSSRAASQLFVDFDNLVNAHRSNRLDLADMYLFEQRLGRLSNSLLDATRNVGSNRRARRNRYDN